VLNASDCGCGLVYNAALSSCASLHSCWRVLLILQSIGACSCGCVCLYASAGRGGGGCRGVAAWRRGGVAAWRRGGVAAWRRALLQYCVAACVAVGSLCGYHHKRQRLMLCAASCSCGVRGCARVLCVNVAEFIALSGSLC
jgi:hypothetical protein